MLAMSSTKAIRQWRGGPGGPVETGRVVGGVYGPAGAGIEVDRGRGYLFFSGAMGTRDLLIMDRFKNAR